MIRAGRHLHVQRLIELKTGRARSTCRTRVTYHVLKAPDVVDAILDYARVNRVDHIVVGTAAPDIELSA